MKNDSTPKTQPKLDKRILFTGGGSGGHIAAATAVIGGLQKQYSNALDQILYVGSTMGMEGEKNSQSLEQKLIGENSSIPFIAIRAGKLQRYLSWTTIVNLFGVFGGFIDSWKVVRNFKPDIIFSAGGFVTVPICFLGWLLRIPVYIHEQTAAVGLTNSITGKFATRAYVSFKQSEQYFNKKKVLHVGNAVRPTILEVGDVQGESVEAIKKMLPNRERLPIILITGGGQGSHLLNITLRQMIGYLAEDFQVILQTGDNSVFHDYDLLMKERNKLPEKCRDRFFPVKFIPGEELGYVFQFTDLFIGRSGANFVYEVGVLQIPSIFVPIPWVTHNEQYKNAETLVDLGLSKIVPEGEVTAERMYAEIKKFLAEIKNGKQKINHDELKKAYPIDAVERIIADLPL